MPPESDFIADLLKLGESALTDFLKNNGKNATSLRKKSRAVADSLDLVSRHEFDAALGLIAKAHARLDAFDARLRIIESKLILSKTSAPKKTTPRRLRSVKHTKRGR